MKKIIYIVSLAILSLQGCKLESEMYDQINPTVFPKTDKDVEALINGCCYSVFKNNQYEGIFEVATEGVLMLSETASDLSGCEWSDRDPLMYGRWRVGGGYLHVMYDRYVRFVNSMLLNMDRVQNCSIDEDKKSRYIAELQCGRGFLAFLLYDCWGPIPLADLETLKNPLVEKILPRATEEEMQTLIETSLTEAAKVLPTVYRKGDADYGRFSKGVCYMLLLKYYMLTKQWDKAEAAGRELMKPEYGYGLMPTYKSIFTQANEKNEETIFSINCIPGNTPQRWHPHVLPTDYPSDPPQVMKWGGYKIAWDFMHTFEEGDQRLEVIVTEYTGTSGAYHNEETDVANNGFLKYGAIPIKYEFDKTTTGESSQIDLIIYRYADALTLLSEAIVRRGNAVTQEAVDLLNMVRTRAGLQAYTLASFSGPSDFLDKLLLERGHELWWEGARRQDLIRHGVYVDVMKNKARIMGQITTIDENYVRFPLSQSRIDEGKGIVEQNPGY